MKKEIVCINVSGGNLPLAVSEHLLNASIGMFLNKVDYTKIDGMTYGGGITTAFRQVSFGQFSGIEFTADLEIEVEGRTHKVLAKYLVEPEILMEGYADFEMSQLTAWEFLLNILAGAMLAAEENKERTYH